MPSGLAGEGKAGADFSPGEFEDVKAGAEKGGVSQSLELAQEFLVILPGGESLQQPGGEVDEVAFLAGGAEGLQAGGGCRLPHPGEVEMSGEVALARVLEGVVPGLVVGVGLQGAIGAVGVVVVAALEAVVDEEEEGVGEDP